MVPAAVASLDGPPDAVAGEETRMHSRIARYGFTGDPQELARRAEKGMLPIFQSVGVRGVTTSSPQPQQQLWADVAYSIEI